MKQALFLAAAREELLAEVPYYNEAQDWLGQRFTVAVETAGTRRMRVRGFPYSVFYRPQEDGIIIFTIAHHARRPGYWANRKAGA